MKMEKVITVRLTQAQAETISAAAEVAGMKVSAFLRNAAIDRAKNLIDATTNGIHAPKQVTLTADIQEAMGRVDRAAGKILDNPTSAFRNDQESELVRASMALLNRIRRTQEV